MMFVVSVLNLRFEQQLHHCECIAEIMEFAVDRLYTEIKAEEKMFFIIPVKLQKILAVRK